MCCFSVGRDALSAEDMGIEDYEMQTRNALMGEFISGFECELKEAVDKDDKSLQLIWKKVVEKDHIKVSHEGFCFCCGILHFCFSRHGLFVVCFIVLACYVVALLCCCHIVRDSKHCFPSVHM